MIEIRREICVVIPAFNREEMLMRAIKSVLDQTYPDFRLVVVDDASTVDMDEPKHFVQSPGHDWLTLDRNSGPARARNVGADFCQWDWVCFLDSDDEWHPEKLERQVAWHQQNPEVRISQVKEKWVRNGREIKRPAHWKQKEGDLFSESVQRCSIGPSCVMIRHDLWSESGGFNEFYRACEDYELWLRICASDPIGLVDGDFLAVKNAGHGDQLSEIIPALDRYRVLALLELLVKDDLSDPQRDWAVQGVVNKGMIMAKGAAKRGKQKEVEFFQTAVGQIEEVDQQVLADWVQNLRDGGM